MTHATTCELLVRNSSCTCAPIRSALQLRAEGDRVSAICPACNGPVRSWEPGASVTVPQVIVAEQQHLAAAHPQAPDYAGIYDGLYEDGLG